MIDWTFVSFLLLIANFGIGGFFAAIHSLRLFFYLKEHHYKTWRSQMIFHDIGFGVANPFKTFPLRKSLSSVLLKNFFNPI